MSAKKPSFPRGLVRCAAFGLLAVAICSTTVILHRRHISEDDAAARAIVIKEVNTGAFTAADDAMNRHPGLWMNTVLSVTDLSQMLASGAVAGVGLLDASHTANGQPEILVTTKKGVLAHVPDNSREMLAERMVLPHADNLHITQVTPDDSSVMRAIFLILFPLLFNLLPVLLLVAIVVRQAAPLLTMFRPARDVTTRFKDVIGASEAKAALTDIMDFMKAPEPYLQLGARPSRGVLLSGPPGTGKTLLAQALAGECGVSFISCSGADFTSMFYGMGIMKVKRLFAVARKQKNCIVFIDEFDGIGRRVSSANGPEGTEFNRIINQMLIEIDGFTSEHKVVVIAATNLVDNVEPALLREGRFDRKIVLDMPTVTDREALFRLYAEKITLADGIDFQLLARMTFSLSPAAIANVVNQAAVRAARSRVKAVTMDHMADALETSHLGETSGIKLNAVERRRTAVHEAGHAYFVVVGRTGRLEKVTVLPRGRALGVTFASNEEDIHLHTREELLNRIDMLLAGRAAEEVILGNVSVGAQDDLKRATELATSMLAKFGFGRGLAYLTDDQLKSAGLLAQVNTLLEERYAHVSALLLVKRGVIEAVAAELEKHETIDGHIVEQLARSELRAA